ncbi:ATP-binding protein [Streptomyces sp. NPDC048172]|uniref:ATP-binding protein n=1 Tax=Streptomyces sp. NPDC048172 TaxID=3365505 RepID=UPI003721E266
MPHGPYEATFRFPRTARSVPRARAMLRSLLDAWDEGEAADTAELLLSELVTNAVRAPAPRDRQVEFTARAAEGALRLEVADAGDGRPEPREAGETDESGRGLFLIAALTERWGVSERAVGKTVWCELKLPTG